MMKRTLIDLATAVGFLLLVSCAHPAPTTTPDAAVIDRARQAAVAIGTLQHAAIELNKTQVCTPAPCHALLTDHDTGVVVDATRDALTTLRAVPDGWPATTDALLALVADRLANQAAFAPYLAGARATVDALKGSR